MVHVLILEELAEAPGRHLRRLQRFLDVPVDGQLKLARVNEARQVRSSTMQYLIRESPLVRTIGRAVIPKKKRLTVGKRTMGYVERRNTVVGRSSMDPALRAELTRRFRPDVERLEVLLSRELGDWKR
jgi:hypothetical protein